MTAKADVPEPAKPSSGHDDTIAADPPSMDGAPARPSAPPSGERYRMGPELGRGGMGRVVEAFDVQLGRSVALKEALPRSGDGGDNSYRRFAREIQITARLEHASIVPLYDSGKTPDGRPFYVMRRVTGRPFDELIARKKNLGERLTLLPALKAAIDAIGHAHRRGVIHRDIKPANILVGDLGETVVIDWGLAKVIGEADLTGDSIDGKQGPLDDDPSASGSLHTQVGSVFGTPGFMAPEQARGEELDPRGDVYALGATLYQMLTGVPPYRGKSATEVIDRNRKAEIQPIEVAAPEAPTELMAIVNKSLAANAEDRYANAGALADDVRRFLEGQLVAAHRYTRAQRVRRFIARHRAPLVVAALAAVAVAALSWFSVHRVLRERALAVEGQRIAEERADALIVARARSLVDLNPTHALAALKQLPPGSPHEPEARALAQAAYVRGVAWGIADDGEIGAIEYPRLSADGHRLALTTLSGRVRVFDADTHALVIERSYPKGTHAVWVSNGARLLVGGHQTPALILDPANGVTTALDVGMFSLVTTDDAGDRVVYTPNDGGAKLLDVAAGKITQLVAGPEKVQTAEIAPDGSWIVIAAAKQTIVFDGNGTEISRRDGTALTVAGSPMHQLTILADNALWQLDLGTLAWTQLPSGLEANEFVLGFAYRGSLLTILTSRAEVLEWTGKSWRSRLKLESLASALVPVGPDLLAISSGDGRIRWIGPASTGELRLPAIVEQARLSGGRAMARLAVTGDDLLLLYDLSRITVSHIDLPYDEPYSFLDDDTLLSWTNGAPWHLYRTKTAQSIELEAPSVGVPTVLDALPEEGRILFDIVEMHEHLIEVRDELSPFHRLATIDSNGNPFQNTFVGALIPGGGVVYASDSALRGRVGDAEPRELVRMQGDVRSIAHLGEGAYGAVSASGELVRGSLTTGVVERARVPKNDLLAVCGYTGKLVVATGDQLMLWSGRGETDADVVEIARFTQPIDRIVEVKGGIAVQLADRRVIDVAQDPATGAWSPSEILPRGTGVVLPANGGELIVSPANGELQIVELPARARWTMPLSTQVSTLVSIAPTSRQIVQRNEGLVTWTLPHIDGDLRAWLDRATNATEDADGDLAWPWQATASH